MKETAVGERNILFLAAAVVGKDDAPVLATDTATPENTTSGGLFWSVPTTSWDVSTLGPKPWWRAEYYYRARWYGPGMDQFLEIDPDGLSEIQGLFTAFASNPHNFIDPSGRVAEPTYDEHFRSQFDGDDLAVSIDEEFRRRIDEFEESRLIPDNSGKLGWFEKMNGLLSATPAVRALETYTRIGHGVTRKNRSSYGVSREYALAWPMAGTHFGDNLQVFEIGGGRFAVGIFGFESWKNWEDRDTDGRSRGTVVASGRPFGVSGANLSVSVAANYAINIGPKDNFQLSSSGLMNGWGGYVKELSFSIGYGGFSGFESINWAGYSVSLGIGSGAFLSNDYYHCLVGPLGVGSVSEIVVISMIYKQGFHFHPAIREFLNPTKDSPVVW